jgi:hypothetical protein
MLFDAHNHAFRVLGGVPRRGIYDNMRTAVDKIGRGKERQVNARFSAMVSHFLFEAGFCNPASGWEKGQIEKNVQDARHRLWQPAPNFSSLAALNDWLETRCRELWAQTPHGSQPGAIADVWAEEVQGLMQLTRPFDGFVEHAKRVSPTCLVHLERNRYSVPASFANRPVSVRVYPERIVVAAEGQIVCEHRRVFARSHEQKSTTTGLRLATLSGGHSTQTGRTPQWRAFRRTAACLPGSATAPAQDAGRRSRDGRDSGLGSPA